MKKLVTLAAAALVVSSAAFARPQAKDQKGQAPEQPNKEELAQQRTERMVDMYGLNSKQEAKLLELNIEYADLFIPHRPGGPGREGEMGGPRPEGPQAGEKPEGPKGEKPQMKPGPQGPQGERPELSEEEKAEFEAKKAEMDAKREEMKAKAEERMAEMKAKKEAYDNALQDIMKKKQFQAYKQDEARRAEQAMQGGNHGPQGPAPQGPQGPRPTPPQGDEPMVIPELQ